MNPISDISSHSTRSPLQSSLAERKQPRQSDPALVKDRATPLRLGLAPNDLVYGIGERGLHNPGFLSSFFQGSQVISDRPFSYDSDVQCARMFTKDGNEIPSENWESSSGNPDLRENVETFEREMGMILSELTQKIAQKPMGALCFSSYLGGLGKHSEVLYEETYTAENELVFRAYSELVARSIKELSGAEGQEILEKVAQAKRLRFPEAVSFGSTARELLLYIGAAVHGMSLLKIKPEDLHTLRHKEGSIHGTAFKAMTEQSHLPMEQRDIAKIRQLRWMVLKPPGNLSDIINCGRVSFMGSRLEKELTAYAKAKKSKIVDKRSIDELIRGIGDESVAAKQAPKLPPPTNPNGLQTRINRFMKWTENAEERGIGTSTDSHVHNFFKKTAHELQYTDDPAEFDKAEEQFSALLTKCAEDVKQQYAVAKTLRQTLLDSWNNEKTRMQKIKADIPKVDTPAAAKNIDPKKVAKKIHKQLMYRHASILQKQPKEFFARANEITEASLSLLDDYDSNREMLIANPFVITKISHPLGEPDISFTAQKSESEKYSAELTKMLWSDPILQYYRLTFATKKWLEKQYTTQGPKVNFQAVAPACNLLQQLKPLANETDPHGNRLKSIVVAHDTALLAATMLEPINSSLDSLLKTINLERQRRR